MTYLLENHTGDRQYCTRQQLWDWLKAESRNQPKPEPSKPRAGRAARRKQMRIFLRGVKRNARAQTRGSRSIGDYLRGGD